MREAAYLKNGDAVVCPDGSVGMLADLAHSPDKALVQFGADGPVGAYAKNALRHASMKEWVAAGLDGVNARIPPGHERV